jgi:uncharacterized protein YciI
MTAALRIAVNDINLCKSTRSAPIPIMDETMAFIIVRFMGRLFLLLSFCSAAFVSQAAQPEHFLIRIWPARIAMVTKPTEAESKTMGEHSAYLKSLYDKGTVLLAGPSENGDKTFGIIVVRAASKAEATKVLEGDPSYKAGIMKGEVLPFHLFLPPTK